MHMSLLRHTPTLFVLILLLTSCGALNGEGPHCPDIPGNNIRLVYYNASDSFPLIGGEKYPELYRFMLEDVEVKNLPNFEEQSPGGLYYDEYPRPGRAIINFDFLTCTGKDASPGLCYAAEIQFKDSFEAYLEKKENNQYRLAYYLNGELIATEENSPRRGSNFVGEIAIYR